MKTIIVPDIHQRTSPVERLLLETAYDEAVFLGDWVDSHLETGKVSSFRDTCIFLRELMTTHPQRAKFVFLVGNHDLQYIHLNCKSSRSSVVVESAYYCTGFSKTKAREWRRVFFDEGIGDEIFLSKFRLCHISQDFLFSHAGVDEAHFAYGETREDFVKKSATEAWIRFRQLSHPRNYLLSDAGECRGGVARKGGVLWLDWRNEFVPSASVGKQVLGHTTVSHPEMKGEGSSESWNFDAEGYYGVLENGCVTAHAYPAAS